MGRLSRCTHRAFTFYFENPISSIETRSAPALTHVLPPIRPVGFPIYVARRPGGSIHSLLPSQLYLLSRKSLSSIPVFLIQDFPDLPVLRGEIEDRFSEGRRCNGREATARLSNVNASSRWRTFIFVWSARDHWPAFRDHRVLSPFSSQYVRAFSDRSLLHHEMQTRHLASQDGREFGAIRQILA